MMLAHPYRVIGHRTVMLFLTGLISCLFSEPAVSREHNHAESADDPGRSLAEHVGNREYDFAEFLKRNGITDGDSVYGQDVSAVLGSYGDIRTGTDAVLGRASSYGNSGKNVDDGACRLTDLFATPSVGRIRCSSGEAGGDFSDRAEVAGVSRDSPSAGKHCLLIHEFRAVPPVNFADGIDFGECESGEGIYDGVPYGSGCTEFWLGNREDNSLSGNCTVFENGISFTVERPDAVKALVLDTVYYDDYIQLWIDVGNAHDIKDDTSRGLRVLNLPNNSFPPETGGKCELGKSRVSRRMTDLWPVILKLSGSSEGADVHTLITVTMRQRVSVTGSGEGYMNFRLFYDNAKLVEKDFWGNSGCLAGLRGSGRAPVGRCLERFVTDSGITENDFGTDGKCMVRNSVRTCHGDFKMPDFISSLKDPDAVWDPLCRKLDVYVPEDGSSAGSSNGENSGNGTGSASGIYGVITENGGGTMSEEERLNTPAERLASDFPEIPGEVLSAYGENVNSDDGTTGDVTTAAVMLQTLQYMQNDIACSGDRDSERSCRIFAGTENSCRTGYFGRMDCCHAPNTADADTYIRLITYMTALRTAGAGLENVSSPHGVWTDGALLGSSQGLISGVGDSIMGTLTSTATDEASREFMQALTVRLADLVEETMGEAAREALFTETVSEEGISMVEMNPAVMGTAQGVMAAYVAYQMIKTMEEIATSCRPGEIETSMKLKLDSCTHTGRSCTKRVLGKCVVHEEKYCCYSSPLARIVMEQLPGDYSGGKPCAGIPVSEISRVDFSGLDLSEWLEYVEKTNILDEGRMSADGLTGKGSALNVNGRAEVSERTADRLDAGE